MPGHESQGPPPRRDEDSKSTLRSTIVVIATVAWAVTEFLPVLVPRIPPVGNISPAFIAFLGAAIAVPEVNRLRRRNRRDDDD